MSIYGYATALPALAEIDPAYLNLNPVIRSI